MRYAASEKTEIIHLVEASHLSTRRTLDKLGIPRATFYRWYDRYLTDGVEALADHRSRPDRVWNRIPDPVRAEIIDLALRETELSPRELAVRFTDEKGYFVSEASVYRLLKAHDLIKPGGRQGEVERLGDIAGPHRGAELPGDDEAREVVEHGGEIAPAPACDLEIGEVGLPELVGRRCLVLKFLGRFDDDVGRAGDKIVRFQQPIDRGL